MAWRYRDRITKSFVDTATYNRSRSRGGTKFERVSDAHWKSSGSVTRKTSGAKEEKNRGGRKGQAETRSNAGKNSKPSDAPKTFRELQEATKAKAKRKMAGWYEDYDDGPEYETGVDY